MSLTPYELNRLKALSDKAGITLPAIVMKNVSLSRKEIKRIELGLASSLGKPVVLVRKRSTVRVFSPETYASRIEQGRRVGIIKNKQQKESVK